MASIVFAVHRDGFVRASGGGGGGGRRGEREGGRGLIQAGGYASGLPAADAAPPHAVRFAASSGYLSRSSW